MPHFPLTPFGRSSNDNRSSLRLHTGTPVLAPHTAETRHLMLDSELLHTMGPPRRGLQRGWRHRRAALDLAEMLRAVRVHLLAGLDILARRGKRFDVEFMAAKASDMGNLKKK